MKTKLVAFSCVLCLMFSMMLCACSDSSANISPVEKEYSKTYSGSTIKPIAVSVDGVLDEEIWESLGWWQNTQLLNDIGVLPKLKLTSFQTEEGIYFASVVYDSNLVSNGYQYPSNNSNWEIYFAVCSDDESLFEEKNIGRWSYRKLFIGMYGEMFSWYTNVDRAVVVEGELNSGDTTSATIEMFVPWSAIGYDVDTKGVPSSFGMLPCYRYISADSAQSTWMSPLDGNIGGLGSVFIFDKTGFVNADNTHPDSVVGDGAYGFSKSRGWDYSEIDQGIIRSNRGGTEKIYFRDMYGENFIVETTIAPIGGGGNAGISFIQADGNVHSAFLPMTNVVATEDGTLHFADYTIQSVVGGARTESVKLSGYDVNHPNATKAEGVKLTVVKYGSQFWYFADGKYLTTQTINEMDSNCMPGLYSEGAWAIYKEFSCKEINKADAEAYLAEYGITAFGDS